MTITLSCVIFSLYIKVELTVVIFQEHQKSYSFSMNKFKFKTANFGGSFNQVPYYIKSVTLGSLDRVIHLIRAPNLKNSNATLKYFPKIKLT